MTIPNWLTYLLLIILIILIVIYTARGILPFNPWGGKDPQSEDDGNIFAGDEIFRFLEVRPPDKLPENQVRKSLQNRNIVEIERSGSSVLLQELEDLDKQILHPKQLLKSRATILKSSTNLQEIVENPDLQEDRKRGAKLKTLLQKQGFQNIQEVQQSVKELCKTETLNDLLSGDTFQQKYNQVWDSYMAASLLKTAYPIRSILKELIAFYATLELVNRETNLKSLYAFANAAQQRIRIPLQSPTTLAVRSTPVEEPDNGEPQEEGVIGAVNLLGIGDLRLVRQEVVRYIPYEIAHVENVMGREFRERERTETDRVEELQLEETETTTEEEKDLQTTERYEMQREVAEVVNTALGIEAGVNVTASYGTVTVNADTRFNYDQSSSTAKQSSINYSKETVDRAVFRIQEKIRRKRETKTFREIIERNLHGFDNKKSKDHVIGIYRWLNKEYQNKLINYGKRLMVEIIVPEPAKFYSYANKTPEELAIAQLQEPLHPNQTRDADYPSNIPDLTDQQLLTSEDLTEENYLFWAAEYNVQELDSYPKSRTLSTMISHSSENEVIFKAENAKDFNIDEGFIAVKYKYSYVIHINSADAEENADGDRAFQVWIMIGSNVVTKEELEENEGGFPLGDGGTDKTYYGGADNWLYIEPPGLIGENVAASVIGRKIKSLVVHILVEIEPLPDTIEQWQLNTFEKIMEGYNLQMQEYRDTLARLQAANEATSNERNPLINREIEKRELKKGAISFMREQTFGEDELTDTEGNIPDNQTFESIAQKGRVAQFFEQAFEWENIAYVFYPYFWANLDTWQDKLIKNSKDPLFNKFLQAGYARVIVPARPAYNDLVINYLYEKPENPWEPVDGPPVYNDDLYEDIAAELAPNLEEILEDQWLSTVPTDLIILQKSKSLKGQLTEKELFD